MDITQYLLLQKDEQDAYVATLPAEEVPVFNASVQMELEKQWLDGVNAKAQEVAEELSVLLNAKVEPHVFVIEQLKDAAVAYLKKPDATQGFKILTKMHEIGYENGIVFTARTQLVREYNGTVASDPRFMDVNGTHAPGDEDLNVALLMKCQHLIKPYQDQFKKK